MIPPFVVNSIGPFFTPLLFMSAGAPFNFIDPVFYASVLPNVNVPPFTTKEACFAASGAVPE